MSGREYDVVVAAGFSGHGFELTPVPGEMLADFVVEGEGDHPTGMFRLDRF